MPVREISGVNLLASLREDEKEKQLLDNRKRVIPWLTPF